jgi:Uma2 family endonuclease
MKGRMPMDAPVTKILGKKIYSYSDLLKMPELTYRELFAGELVERMEGASANNQEVLRALTVLFSLYLQGKTCRVFIAPFDLCVAEEGESEDDIKTLFQPDFMVICDQRRLRERGYFGVPEMVIEILSPTTAKRDFTVKYRYYERMGVKEYWLIDSDAKNIIVYILDDNGRYGRRNDYIGNAVITSSIFPGLTVSMEQLYAGIQIAVE